MDLAELTRQQAEARTAILQLRDKITEQKPAKSDPIWEQWTAANTEYDRLAQLIDVEKRTAQIQKDQSDSVAALSTLVQGKPAGTDRSDGLPTEETRRLAFRAWYRFQMDEEPTEQEIDACKRLKVNPAIKKIDLPFIPTHFRKRAVEEARAVHASRRMDVLRRTLSAFTPNLGAYTKWPATLVENLEINMLFYGGVEQVAEVMTTSSGERLQWPTADDTTNTGVQLGENTTIGSSVDPAFGAVYWDAYKFSSKPVLAPYELIEDSAFDLPGVIGAMLGERLGRIGNTKFTTGDGNDTCKGIVVCAGAGITAASQTAIAADEIFRLEHSVDPAYRQGGGFMGHDSILLALRLLKDGNGGYLWQDGMNTGTPDRLIGYTFTVNQDMASSIATGNITLLFGQMFRYKIRRVNGVRLYRLEERYRDSDQDGFIAFLRQDGNLLTAGTAPVKKLTQA